MEKQELIDYCTCRDFRYSDLIALTKLHAELSNIPTEQEYNEGLAKFNSDMEEYFKSSANTGTDGGMDDLSFEDEKR